MPDFIVQATWEYPARLLSTTQQSAAEINNRYQAVGNCAEFVRSQATILRNSAVNLLAEIDGAIANLNSQQTQFNNLASVAQGRVTAANNVQATAQTGTDQIAANNVAINASRTKLTASNAIADITIASGMPRSNNLTGIAAAARANPGILGIDSIGNWIWYNAPSGQPFVIEFQAFSSMLAANINGGPVAANVWNNADINSAGFGNFRGALGIPEDIVDEDNDRLLLKPFFHYWRTVAIGSNTDWMRVRYLLGVTGIGRSLSTQMVADSNTSALRHFNLESIIDRVVEPTADTTLQIQTYHPAVNTAFSSAARGLGSTNTNVFLTGSGWRIRYT